MSHPGPQTDGSSYQQTDGGQSRSSDRQRSQTHPTSAGGEQSAAAKTLLARLGEKLRSCSSSGDQSQAAVNRAANDNVPREFRSTLIGDKQHPVHQLRQQGNLVNQLADSSGHVPQQPERSGGLAADDGALDGVKKIAPNPKGWIQGIADAALRQVLGSGDTSRADGHDRSSRLSAEERAERKRIVHPAEYSAVGFAHGETRLSQPAKEVIAKKYADAIRAAAKDPERKILLVGHASPTGSDATNLQISQERADNVKRFLVDKFNVPADKIVAQGVGEIIGHWVGVKDGTDHAGTRVVQIRIVQNDAAKPDPQKLDDAGKRGRDLGDGSRMSPLKPKYSVSDGMRDLPDLVDAKNPVKTIAKVAKETVKRLVDGLHELYKRSGDAAAQDGLKHAGMAILLDATPNRTPITNSHLVIGTPYTVQEVYKEAHKHFSDATSKFGPNSESRFKEGVTRAVDAANQLLKLGKTPEQRLALIRRFNRELQEHIALQQQRETRLRQQGK